MVLRDREHPLEEEIVQNGKSKRQKSVVEEHKTA